MIAAKIDIDTLEVVKYFNAPAASNLTKEWPLAMVKVDDVDDGVYLIGYEDGDFEDEDVEPDGERHRGMAFTISDIKLLPILSVSIVSTGCTNILLIGDVGKER